MTQEVLKNQSRDDLFNNKFLNENGQVSFPKEAMYRVSNTNRITNEQELSYYKDFGLAYKKAKELFHKNKDSNWFVNFEFRTEWLNYITWVCFNSIELEFLQLYADEGKDEDDDGTIEFMDYKYMADNNYKGESLAKYNFRVSSTNMSTLKQECIHFVTFQEAWAKYYEILANNPNTTDKIHLEKKVNWHGKTSWILGQYEDIEVINRIAIDIATANGMQL
ncbi:MAG: hypothetical protein N4A71_15035 [Carboxylicivirga sp.]|jgi:hypothetical protein|nr:hypothetical protein [Carboxylicivirga sp.]